MILPLPRCTLQEGSIRELPDPARGNSEKPNPFIPQLLNKKERRDHSEKRYFHFPEFSGKLLAVLP